MAVTSSAPRALLLCPRVPCSYWNMETICKLAGRRAVAPPLGLLTVAALLPPSWQLRLVDENVQPITPDDWDWAEVVLISAMIVHHKRLRELIQEATGRGKMVVVGGPYPTVVPAEVLAWGPDIVVKGEFENLVEPFCDTFASGRTGVILESPHKPDLQTSPIPRFDLLERQHYLSLSIQTSRGCPFDCEFCDVVSIFGRKVRQKTAHQVLAELEALHRLGWRQEIFISDDNFIGNKAYARDLLQRLIPWQKSRGEPFNFWTQTSVNLGQDRDLIDLMTEANFSTVFIGIESPDQEVLRITRKHQNLRHPLVDSIRTITANGLTVMGSFIMGFDNEAAGAGGRIAAFVEATNLPNVMLNLLVPLPHTRLWERLNKEDRLRADSLLYIMEEGDALLDRLPFKPVRPEAEILLEYLQVWDRLYDRANYLARAYRYYLDMRPTRAALARARGEQVAPPANGKPGAASVRSSLKDLRGLLRLSWHQGIKPPTRFQYWLQLLKLLRRNPTRVIRYLKTCAMGEDMFHLREVLHNRLETYLKGLPQDRAAA